MKAEAQEKLVMQQNNEVDLLKNKVSQNSCWDPEKTGPNSSWTLSRCYHKIHPSNFLASKYRERETFSSPSSTTCYQIKTADTVCVFHYHTIIRFIEKVDFTKEFIIFYFRLFDASASVFASFWFGLDPQVSSDCRSKSWLSVKPV